MGNISDKETQITEVNSDVYSDDQTPFSQGGMLTLKFNHSAEDDIYNEIDLFKVRMRYHGSSSTVKSSNTRNGQEVQKLKKNKFQITLSEIHENETISVICLQRKSNFDPEYKQVGEISFKIVDLIK